MPELHARSRSSSAVPTQTMSQFARTSRELVKNIAVQCLSPTLPRDVPPELLERSRKVAEDQRRIIATRAGASSDSSRSSHASVDYITNDAAADLCDWDENGDVNDDEPHKMSQDDVDNNTSSNRTPALDTRAQVPLSASAPNSPRVDPTQQPEPRSAPPYPTTTSTGVPSQMRQDYTSNLHTSNRFGGPPLFVQYRSGQPPLHSRPYPLTPFTAPYNVRKGPKRRQHAPTYPYYHQAPPSAPAGRPDPWRRLDYLENAVSDLMQQVSDLQATNRKLLESQLRQSELVNLYGLARSGTLSPTQFSRFMATFASKVDFANLVTPTTSEPLGKSAPNSGPSSGSRSSSSDIQSEIFEIIQREQRAGDRARGTRLGPNEIPPESEFMPSPRLHPPADWGRLNRSKAPPSEVKTYSPTDKSVPLAGRRCGRLFALNLDVLRQTSQPMHSANPVKQESESPSDRMDEANDSDDYDEPAESALTPEAEAPNDVSAKQELAMASQVPSQFMSMCTKMWHVLEA